LSIHFQSLVESPDFLYPVVLAEKCDWGKLFLSHYIPLVPSQHEYFTKFKDIDETDLDIISEMKKRCPEGPRNLKKIAESLNLPQQTVNYRVLRFEHLDLVRFRAILDETLLGLANYAVIATVRPGLQYENIRGKAVNAGTFLTCYPMWRLLKEIHGGFTHGFYTNYSIPWRKEADLKKFLEELQNIGCIEMVNDFCRVTSPNFNVPSLNLYQAIRKAYKQGRLVSFDWMKWADRFDKAEEVILPKETVPKRKFQFSYEHLQILFHLERNLREKTVDIARSIGAPSPKVANWLKEIFANRLIVGCRVELYPIDPATSISFILRLQFTNTVALRKFISLLNEIPYPVTYQKVFEKDIILLHITIPPSEYFAFHNGLEILGRREGIIHSFDLFVGNHIATFDNIMLYEAFSKEENDWLFSYEVLHNALKRLLDATKFEF